MNQNQYNAIHTAFIFFFSTHIKREARFTLETRSTAKRRGTELLPYSDRFRNLTVT